MNRSTRWSDLRHWLVVAGFGAAGVMGMVPVQAQELCGGVDYPFPYTDVSGVGAAFCPGIMEAYVTGVSKGTTPTTFSPNNTVTRVQMTTFLQRSLDQGLARASRRGALNQWWTPESLSAATQGISIGPSPVYCAADGKDIWTSTFGTVVQVQANTGKVLGTWTGATNDRGILVAAGKVFADGDTAPGSLYLIDPTLAPGAVSLAASNLGNNPAGIAFDGTHLWTANNAGSVSIITLAATTPYPPGNVTTVSTGFSVLTGIVYDGAHIWVADSGAGTLLKLDAAGAILQTVAVGTNPAQLGFDGANIWVPNAGSNSVTVVQASSGSVVATIPADASNLLNAPIGAAFDGERMLVTNFGNGSSNSSVSVFKAADLSFIVNLATGGGPISPCSDGINFFVPLENAATLLRF
jgi:YVTN family beta-propeller protein